MLGDVFFSLVDFALKISTTDLRQINSPLLFPGASLHANMESSINLLRFNEEPRKS